MDAAITGAFFAGVVAYSVASTLFLAELYRREGSSPARKWAPRALAVGLVFHGAHVVGASLLTNTCPVRSINFMLSLSAWIAVAGYLSIRARWNFHAIGAVVGPIALTFLVSAEFVSARPDDSVPTGLLAVHVTANLLGVGLFILAGAAGAFYLVQDNRLKAKQLGGLSNKLPPLDTLDFTEHRLLVAGFLLLTLGIVTGAVFAGGLGSSSGTGFARVLVAFGTWLLVALVLVLRAVLGWRGRRAAYGTIAGAIGVALVVAVYVLRGTGA